jgi:hypothetical protein
MNYEFLGCEAGLNVGTLVSADGRPAVIDCEGQSLVTFHCAPVIGTWGTARIEVYQANTLADGWYALDPVVALTSATNAVTVAVDADTRYLCAYVHSVNGASLILNVYAYTRPEVLGA